MVYNNNWNNIYYLCINRYFKFVYVFGCFELIDKSSFVYIYGFIKCYLVYIWNGGRCGKVDDSFRF